MLLSCAYTIYYAAHILYTTLPRTYYCISSISSALRSTIPSDIRSTTIGGGRIRSHAVLADDAAALAVQRNFIADGALRVELANH